MHVWWGADLINIYNDAHIPVLGKKHPDALGRPASAVWADVWPVLATQVETVMQRGESTWNELTHVILERNGFPEDAWFTWSYSPIRQPTGRIGGLGLGLVIVKGIVDLHGGTIAATSEGRDRGTIIALRC